MGRYLRLYANFVRFSFSRAMEFRFDFFFRFGMDVAWYAIQFAFFHVLYGHTTLLGGWTFDEVTLFLVAVFVSDALEMTVFASNMWFLPILVNRGDLDYYLVRPVSSLFFLSLREFAANSFLNLLLACGLMAWALAAFPGPLEIWRILLWILLLLVGVLLFHFIHLLFLLPVFWMHQSSGLREVFWSVGNYAHRPDGIFTGWLRRFFTTVLPMALIVSFPTRLLLGEPALPIVAQVLGATLAFYLLVRIFWGLALRSYASASS